MTSYIQKQPFAASAIEQINPLGFGLGLRSEHYPYLMQKPVTGVDWFEIISENYIDNYGYGRHVLEQLMADFPIVMHGVSMNIGSSSALDFDYLEKLKVLADFVKPAWISDHLCWTGFAGVNSHDLLPMPLTEESLKHVINRVNQVQDFLQRPLVLENPSTYLEFQNSSLTEPEFFTQLVEQTQCAMLLDVNNVYVSAYNHGFCPKTYIKNLPLKSIVQMHLAGPTLSGHCLIDTHDKPVPEPVWELYQLAQSLCGPVSTLLEWDANIPAFPELVAELNKAKTVLAGQIPHAPVQNNHQQGCISTPLVLAKEKL
ncbi:MAG: DUF692 domain-containing protein [Pseudoalteromonas rhizosphaerae]|uniref:MNIO family bufferin maturase n=1 Tax=Pseudoalteromonas rhizosphaerae TaxID=2518973 RepID=UPI003C762EC0